MVQTWPDESFTIVNTPFNGVGADLYVSAEPFSTNPETTTGFALSTAQGTPFDGYQNEALQRQGRCGVARNAGNGDDGDLVVCVTRQGFDEDTRISGFPAYEVRSGAPDGRSFRGWGVCSHVGATYTGAADPGNSYLSTLSGYFLLEVKSASLSQTILLLKVSSGAITEIASALVRDVDPALSTLTADRYAPPRPLTLVSSKSGTTINLQAFRTNVDGSRVDVFGGVQSQSGALAYGSAGFVVQSANDTSPATITGLIERFFVGDSTATTLFDDEFQRTNRLAARELSDALVTGRSLASAWIGDDESYTTASGATGTVKSQFEIQSTSESVFIGEDPSDGTTFSGFHLWQNPVADPNQRYIATLNRLNNDTAKTVEFGLASRFTVIPYPTFSECRGRIPVGSSNIRTDVYKIGYTATVKYESGPTWTLELRHYEPVLSGSSYVAPVIASAPLAAFSLAVGTPFTLEMSVQNFDGNEVGFGDFVAIEIAIDGATVSGSTLWEVGSTAGVGIVDDFIVDTRSVATGAGAGVGIVVIPEELGTSALVEVEDFAPALGNGGSTTTISDQVSISVDSETDSKSGTLTIPLDSNVTETSSTAPIEHIFESGQRQRILSQPIDRPQFEVRATLTGAEFDSLVALFRSNGTSAGFDWTHYRTGETIAVRFTTNIQVDFTHIDAAQRIYRVRFSLEQLFDTDILNG